MSSQTLFRPPAEANSLIIRIAEGCPWNNCTFCGMYKQVTYRLLSFEEIESNIAEAYKINPLSRKIFLADGDVMLLSTDKLQNILQLINSIFPRVTRINVYANGGSILSKTDAQLLLLKSLKLNTLYMGLESGDELTLKNVNKKDSAADMVAAVQKAQKAGMRMSVMILIGLAGQKNSNRHANETASALNMMQPKLLSALRVIPIPGTKLFDEEQNGIFSQLTEFQSIVELREIISKLKLKNCVFRANHSSNILPLEGRFPKDKGRIISELDYLIDSGMLSKTSPAESPLWL
ncbi:MAG: radical SAM protein [Chlamydiae bacterium]|nr:MAG: radical SAM protein [Chlamydiota bacterium]